jgi:phosphocarrier protein
MGVMMLAAAKGSVIQIETEGPDELDALVALQALFASGFDDFLS